MAIVPDDDRRAIEVRLAPADIDQVTLGQPAVIRFAAFNQRTTPELNGTVSRLAADLTKDPQTGALYYTARLSVAPDELARLGMELVAGMPVDAFIRTGERTALSYFTRPFTDRMARTFLEE